MGKYSMVILGIDPGTADTGWGVIEVKSQKPKVKSFGSVKTKPGMLMEKRLLVLYKELKTIILAHKPELIVIERLFFNTNAKTAMSVGQARGVVMLLCAQHKCELVEYTALQAKLELTGYGRAEKKEMQKRVGEILKIKEKIWPDDAADGLAMALCYLSKNGLINLEV